MDRSAIRSSFAVMNNAFAKYSFEYFLDSMESLGLDMIDLWGGVQHFNPYSVTERSVAELRSHIEMRGMKVVVYTPELLAYPFNFASPDARTRQESVDFALRNLDIAKVFGTDKMLISPGWGLLDIDVETSRGYAADCLHQVSEAAGKRGISLLLEHLTPQSSNLIFNLDALLDMLDRVNHPALNAVLDLGQMGVFGENVSDYIKALGDKLQHVHIMDGAPACHLAFGDGIFPLEEYWNTLHRDGYCGLYTLEINDGRYAAHPREALQKCVDTLLKWSTSC